MPCHEMISIVVIVVFSILLLHRHLQTPSPSEPSTAMDDIAEAYMEAYKQGLREPAQAAKTSPYSTRPTGTTYTPTSYPSPPPTGGILAAIGNYCKWTLGFIIFAFAAYFVLVFFWNLYGQHVWQWLRNLPQHPRVQHALQYLRELPGHSRDGAYDLYLRLRYNIVVDTLLWWKQKVRNFIYDWAFTAFCTSLFLWFAYSLGSILFKPVNPLDVAVPMEDLAAHGFDVPDWVTDTARKQKERAGSYYDKIPSIGSDPYVQESKKWWFDFWSTPEEEYKPETRIRPLEYDPNSEESKYKRWPPLRGAPKEEDPDTMWARLMAEKKSKISASKSAQQNDEPTAVIVTVGEGDQKKDVVISTETVYRTSTKTVGAGIERTTVSVSTATRWATVFRAETTKLVALPIETSTITKTVTQEPLEPPKAEPVVKTVIHALVPDPVTSWLTKTADRWFTSTTVEKITEISTKLQPTIIANVTPTTIFSIRHSTTTLLDTVTLDGINLTETISASPATVTLPGMNLTETVSAKPETITLPGINHTETISAKPETITLAGANFTETIPAKPETITVQDPHMPFHHDHDHDHDSHHHVRTDVDDVVWCKFCKQYHCCQLPY